MKRAGLPPIVWVILSATSLGCSGEATTNHTVAGEWTGTAADSAGVRIVVNPDQGLWTSESRWKLERDLTIAFWTVRRSTSLVGSSMST